MSEFLQGRDGCDADCEALYVRPDVVAAVMVQMPSTADAAMMAETFKLLGDPTRLRIIQALSYGELCVCDLAEMLGVGRPAVSNHLRLLRTARLVRHRKEGKLAFYALGGDHLAVLLAGCRAHVEHGTPAGSPG